MARTVRWTMCVLFFLLALPVESIGQSLDSTQTRYYSDSGRRWLLDVPLWVPGLRGQLSYGTLDFSSGGGEDEREFERLNGDSGLEFYFSGRFQVDLGRFQAYIDGFTGRIGTSFSLMKRDGTADELIYFRVNGSVVRFLGGYRFYESPTNSNRSWAVYAQAGVRYVNMGLYAEVGSSSEIIDEEPTFFEPMIGILSPVDLGRFRLEVQADISAWADSFSWTLGNRYRYRISPLVDVHLGWTWLNVDYRNDSGRQELDLDVSLFGPTAGVGFWLK